MPQQCLSCELCWESNYALFILQGACKLLARHTGHCQKEKPMRHPITVSTVNSSSWWCWQKAIKATVGNHWLELLWGTPFNQDFLDWVSYQRGPFKVSGLLHHSISPFHVETVLCWEQQLYLISNTEVVTIFSTVWTHATDYRWLN